MEASEGRSALHGLEERVFKLVSRKATSAQWAEWLRAPLEHALAEGDEDLAKSLLKAGANGGAGWKGCDGRTLLDAAAEGGNHGAISAIIKVGKLADLNTVSGSKSMTALHRACKGGHIAAAQALLVEGADVGRIDSDGCSALHHALRGGHEELAKHVIAAGADLNAKERGGDRPLHLAAALDSDKIVCTLMRRGVGVDVANSKGQSALHVAVAGNHLGPAEALLEEGANPNLRYAGCVNNNCSPLFLAQRNVAMSKMLLKHGADFKSVDSLGYTALHWAAERGAPSVIEALVDGGADIEARSAVVCFYNRKFLCKGLTPLFEAARCHSLSNMATLLHRGANIHARDDDGQTPLHFVCKMSAFLYCAHTAIDFLLRRGADETITDNNGHTARDLLESSAATARLQKLLADAPVDRKWRRRGMLVLCRAHLAKVPGGTGDGKTGKIPCRRQGSGARAADGGGGDESGFMVTRVVELEAEEVFRAIVGFL